MLLRFQLQTPRTPSCIHIKSISRDPEGNRNHVRTKGRTEVAARHETQTGKEEKRTEKIVREKEKEKTCRGGCANANSKSKTDAPATRILDEIKPNWSVLSKSLFSQIPGIDIRIHKIQTKKTTKGRRREAMYKRLDKTETGHIKQPHASLVDPQLVVVLAAAAVVVLAHEDLVILLRLRLPVHHVRLVPAILLVPVPAIHPLSHTSTSSVSGPCTPGPCRQGAT